MIQAGPYFDVRRFGARGNGTADDTNAIGAAIAAASAAKGAVWFPAGTYRTTAPLTPTAPVRLVGVSRKGSVIVNADSDVFHWGVRDSAVMHMRIKSEMGGGHVFDQTGPVTHNLFYDVEVEQDNLDKTIYRHVNDAGNYLFNQWLHCKGIHSRNATAPGFHFLVSTSAGATNFNVWRNLEFNSSGTGYAFHMESARDGNYLLDLRWLDVAWEVPSGGCVKLLGGNHCNFERNTVYDLNVQVASQHLFYVGGGTHPTGPAPSRHIRFSGLNHAGQNAQLAAGVQHIFFESGKVVDSLVEHCRQNVTGPLLVDYGGNRVLEIGCPSMTRLNAGNVTEVGRDGVVMRSPDGTRYKLAQPPNGGGAATWAAA